MSQDWASDGSAADLPEPVGEWLEAVASERGIDREELLGRLLAPSGGDTAMQARFEAVEDRLDAIEETVDDRLAALDAELEENITDVRERVIQVKREADEKAPAAHDHDDLETTLDDVSETVDDVSEDLDDLGESIEALEARLEDDLDAASAARESLRSDVESDQAEVSRKLDVLASAVLDLREQVGELAGRQSRAAAVDDLAAAAQEHGARRASCEGCGGTVDIGLLAAPTCPHCGRDFRAFEPKQGFFGSHVLQTGTPPALDGTVDPDDDLDDFVE